MGLLLGRGHRVTLLLAALAGTGIAFGGLPDAIAAQETPRGVTRDLFDDALRDTLDTPPSGRVMSRVPIRPGPAILFVGACSLLVGLVWRRGWPRGRGALVGNSSSSATGAQKSALESPAKPRSPRRTQTPIDLPPNVVDFLRRAAQRRREAQVRSEAAGQEKPIPSGHDDGSSPPAWPRIDVRIPGYGARRGDE